MSHWSGLRPLASATLLILSPHWDTSWICCCPVSWRFYSIISAGVATSHTPTVHRGGGYCGSSFWVVAELVSSPTFSHGHLGELSSTAPASSSNGPNSEASFILFAATLFKIFTEACAEGTFS